KEKFQQILENKCKEYRYDPVQEYCKICKRDDFDENGDYNPCCHFKEKIDFVKVFEFAKFSKEYCNKYEDHYANISRHDELLRLKALPHVINSGIIPLISDKIRQIPGKICITQGKIQLYFQAKISMNSHKK
ncbi:22618_t:CDS:2, partial [Gigaspora margarita]